jgi:hypothetical protein
MNSAQVITSARQNLSLDLIYGRKTQEKAVWHAQDRLLVLSSSMSMACFAYPNQERKESHDPDGWLKNKEPEKA